MTDNFQAGPPRAETGADGHDTGPRRARVGFGTVLAAAVWLALVTGLAEVLVLTFRKFALDETLGLSRHYVWMAPAGYVILLVPAAGVLEVMRRVTGLRLGHVVGFLAILSALGLLFMFPRLHRVAMLVLAGGIGVQSARIVLRHERSFLALVRRSLPGLTGLVLLAGLALGASSWLRERTALAALPAARAGAPNVLLIILDTVRAASLGLHGYERPTTPNLERFAERGTVFDRAIATSPWTLPSHASLFTGRWPHELATSWRTPFQAPDTTLAEWFAAAGYATAAFVGNPFYASWEHGLERGFTRYEDYPVSLGQTINSASLGGLVFSGRPGQHHGLFRRLTADYQYLGRLEADHITDRFLHWRSRAPDRPYFAFLNYMDAHVPYAPPEEYQRRFAARPPPPLLHRLTRNTSTLTPGQRAAGDNDQDRYDAAIAFIDHELGRLFGELDRRGELDNTLVVVTSDHGEQFGEWRYRDRPVYDHANSLYMPVLHVPLLFVYPPSVPRGQRVTRMASLRGIAATIAELASPGEAYPFAGESLATFWTGAPAGTDDILASVHRGIKVEEELPHAAGDMYSLIRADTQYIRNGDGSEESYDLAGGGDQGPDLTSSPQAAPLLVKFRAAMARLIGSGVAPEDSPPAAPADGDDR